MRYYLTLLFCSLSSVMVAQTDSSWIDLGRIRLKKDFTQTVTVKAKDLEQMPFSTLDEVLNVWFSGLLTTKSTVVYVVDGSMLADVHAYSIHDIEEITLVQNASAYLNGAHANHLVVISTKKNRSLASGLTIAGSAYAATNSFSSGSVVDEGETNLYHRYDVSAWKHQQKIQYGVSASYLHDVYPYFKNGIDINTPYSLNRFRFHGYLNAQVDSRNSLWLRAGYVPTAQQADMTTYDAMPANRQFKKREKLFTIEAGWNAVIGGQWHNELRVGYAPAKLKGTNNAKSLVPPTGPGYYPDRDDRFTNRYNNLLLNDRVSYHLQVGGFSVDPALDLNFRKMDWKTSNASRSGGSGGLGGGLYSESEFKTNVGVFLVTPSVNVTYKNRFDVQAGLVFNPSHNKYSAEAAKIRPFVSAAVNVLNAAADEAVSWKLFGSYAASGKFSDQYYPLTDAGGGREYVDPRNWQRTQWYYPTYGGDKGAYNWQAGTTFAFMQKRMEFSYNYEYNKYNVLVFSLGYNGLDTYVGGVGKARMHRAGITAQVIQSAKAHWSVGLNASSSRTKTVVDGIIVYNDNGKRLWTGGLVNRFQYGRLLAGVDLLYVLNYRYLTPFSYAYKNGITLNNLYVGYQLRVKNKPLDLFVETRNPIIQDDSRMPDRRQYYGTGFKAII